MYEIKFAFSLTDEKFIIVKITEQSRKIKMIRSDFSKEIWETIQEIGNVLTTNITARGGALIQNIAVSHENLITGSKSKYKSIIFS